MSAVVEQPPQNLVAKTNNYLSFLTSQNNRWVDPLVWARLTHVPVVS